MEKEVVNKELNLYKILKNLEGITLYCTILGNVTLKEVRDSSYEFPIVIVSTFDYKNNIEIYLTKKGTYYSDTGECILFPSEDQRDWSKFKKPIPEGTPMMCSTNKLSWVLRYYGEKIKSHSVYADPRYPKSLEIWDYVIPYSKFNPSDIETSLKFDIQNEE